MISQIADTELSATYAGVHRHLDNLLSNADHEAYDLVMASVLANRTKGDAVAAFVVAPPSTGKTEFVNALADVEWVYEISDLTPKTLISGFKPDDGRETSLLRRLTNDGVTCLLIKEFITILEKPHSDREQIVSQLREVMDGALRKEYGTGDPVHWTGKLGFIAAVTNKIDETWRDQSVLGDRWIFIRVKQATDIQSRLDVGLATLLAKDSRSEYREELKSATADLIESSYYKGVPKIDEKSARFIVKMGEIAARGRGIIPRDPETREVIGEPVIEGSSRLVTTFARIAQSVAQVRGHKEMEPSDLAAIRRVVEDTSPPNRAKVYRIVSKGRFATDEIIEQGKLTRTHGRRVLEDLAFLGLIEKYSESSGSVGRPKDYWRVTPLGE